MNSCPSGYRNSESKLAISMLTSQVKSISVSILILCRVCFIR